jgi:hypothetical protein
MQDKSRPTTNSTTPTPLTDEEFFARVGSVVRGGSADGRGLCSQAPLETQLRWGLIPKQQAASATSGRREIVGERLASSRLRQVVLAGDLGKAGQRGRGAHCRELQRDEG